MIVLLEGQPERVHLAVALVALLGPRYVHAFAKRHVLVLGQLGVHRDGNVRDAPSQQLVSDPMPAQDGVVVEITGVSNQPGRVRQDPHPLVFGKLERLGGRFPVGRQIIGQRIAMVPVAVDVDQVLGGGEQGLEDLLVLFKHVHDQRVEIVHQGGSPVLVPFDLILEDVLRLQVVEILLEELQQSVSCRRAFLIIEQTAGFRHQDLPR